jgi:hypothetical protein
MAGWAESFWAKALGPETTPAALDAKRRDDMLYAFTAATVR